jgi:hypothetical protein
MRVVLNANQDEHLKQLGNYRGIKILTPAEFLRDVLAQL